MVDLWSDKMRVPIRRDTRELILSCEDKVSRRPSVSWEESYQKPN